ncbi:MAG: hypothetical protein ABUL44_00835, partial [Flavobacterium sp.]
MYEYYMIKLAISITIIAAFNIVGKYDTTIGDRTSLLANTTSKSWYIYSTTPESGHPTCLSTHAISLDN